MRVVLQFDEQVREGAIGQQAGVFGKEGEAAALQEGGNGLWVVALGVEGLGEAGKVLGDVAGDAGAGVEGSGIGPDGAQAVADGGVAQVLEVDAVRLGIGEAQVGAAGAGEFAVEFDDVVDVADDEEGRTALGGGQVADVNAGLVVGALEGEVPGAGAAHAVAGFVGRRVLVEQAELIGMGGGLGVGALLGFEDKAAAFVEIGVDGGRSAIVFGASGRAGGRRRSG
ncbi:MAG: hypothetical protein J6386_02615 [Candidatus Synoicihabitans palmerolidicus]|nr:hypothetical protein [Candidatus Synoicihabitans palmerolidicus]